MLAAGLRNGQILFWDIPHRRRLALADGHFGPVTAMTASSDGQTLASASTGGDVRLWNAQTGEEIMPLNAPHTDVRCLRFSPDDSLLVAGLEDGALVVWRARP